MMNIGRIMGFPSELEGNPSDTFILPTCRVGFEFEYEGGSRADTSSFNLSHTHDGSLRDGGEYIFSSPCYGDSILETLKGLKRELVDIDLNYRTSIHVHVDVRDLTVPQYLEMIKYYALLEPTLFHMNPSRSGNPYCLPLKTTLELESNFRVLRGILRGDGHIATVSEWDKYGSLNLGATRKFGSVEIRVFESTLSYDKWIECINLAMVPKYLTLNPDCTLEETLGVLGIPYIEDTSTFELVESIGRGRGSPIIDDSGFYLSQRDSRERIEDVVVREGVEEEGEEEGEEDIVADRISGYFITSPTSSSPPTWITTGA